MSSARYTVPNPPLPIVARILYLPMIWPRKNIGPSIVLSGRFYHEGAKSTKIHEGVFRQNNFRVLWILRGFVIMPQSDRFDHYNRCVHRFFAPALDPGDETVTLPRDESVHLTRVMRLGVGDSVAVFDGRGHEFLARVVGFERRDVRVQLLSRVEA